MPHQLDTWYCNCWGINHLRIQQCFGGPITVDVFEGWMIFADDVNGS